MNGDRLVSVTIALVMIILLLLLIFVPPVDNTPEAHEPFSEEFLRAIEQEKASRIRIIKVEDEAYEPLHGIDLVKKSGMPCDLYDAEKGQFRAFDIPDEETAKETTAVQEIPAHVAIPATAAEVIITPATVPETTEEVVIEQTTVQEDVPERDTADPDPGVYLQADSPAGDMAPCDVPEGDSDSDGRPGVTPGDIPIYSVIDETGVERTLSPELQRYAFGCLAARGHAWYYPYFICQIFQESRFDQGAVSPTGDYGLCQISGAYHAEHAAAAGIPGADLINDPFANIYVGAHIMSTNIEITGNIRQAISRYFTGNDTYYEPYVQQVMQWMDRLVVIN